jgi:nitrogen regulatory protein P-II 1
VLFRSDTKHTELYRSEEYVVDSKSKCKVETIIPQNLVARAVAVLSRSRHSEKGENGTIIISTVNDVNR